MCLKNKRRFIFGCHQIISRRFNLQHNGKDLFLRWIWVIFPFQTNQYFIPVVPPNAEVSIVQQFIPPDLLFSFFHKIAFIANNNHGHIPTVPVVDSREFVRRMAKVFDLSDVTGTEQSKKITGVKKTKKYDGIPSCCFPNCFCEFNRWFKK